MHKKVGLIVVALTLAGGLSACATSYGIPQGGPHFASWTHAKYSLRGGEKPALSRAEANQAEAEGWWGTRIVYTVDELE